MSESRPSISSARWTGLPDAWPTAAPTDDADTRTARDAARRLAAVALLCPLIGFGVPYGLFTAPFIAESATSQAISLAFMLFYAVGFMLFEATLRWIPALARVPVWSALVRRVFLGLAIVQAGVTLLDHATARQAPPVAARVGFERHGKRGSSFYLRRRAGWPTLSVGHAGGSAAADRLLPGVPALDRLHRTRLGNRRPGWPAPPGTLPGGRSALMSGFHFLADRGGLAKAASSLFTRPP